MEKTQTNEKGRAERERVCVWIISGEESADVI